ncbi:hypothetical protein VJ918_03740 [Adlercreutzia sp. R21]|uniref:hypothetical protein n=1 Tax=Adlercreutzia wanghongyangiae TaxID=3111451 RepID=UPI002DBE7176|nr:hypothetical protein [Adlercreutzia sp. R21]MEC4183914.1 hypothetical protein [Adlercreutzia sp. R21]
MGDVSGGDAVVGQRAPATSDALRDATSEASVAEGVRTEPVAACAPDDARCPCGFVRSVARELAYNAGRARGALIFDLAVLAFCFVGFCGNEYALKPFAAAVFPDSPVAYLVQCHLNDFLGGAAFLAYTNMLLDLVRPDMRIRRLTTSVVYLFLCGIFWEYAAPLFVKASTADPLDLLAYMTGAAAYWLAGSPWTRRSY